MGICLLHEVLLQASSTGNLGWGGPNPGLCEHGNGSKGSIKGEGFCDQYIYDNEQKALSS